MAFRLLTSHKALIFQMVSTSLSREDAENCKTEVLNAKDMYSLIMMDFSKISTIEPGALKTLAEVGSSLLKLRQRVMVIANDTVTKMIEGEGYGELLPCYVGVAPVVEEVDLSGHKVADMDGVAFLKIAAPAVQENFRIYAKMDVEVGIPTICAQKDRPVVEIAGAGGFFCNQRKGNLLLCFKTDSFLKTVSAIMKRKYDKIQPEISDWAAELVNSVLGRVKSDLKSKGYSFSSGIPTVFVGKDLEVFYSSKLPPRLDIVRCTGEFGEFFIEVMMVPSD